MKNNLIQKPLSVKKSLIHGYGVFAEVDIQPEEIIEECHILVFKKENCAFSNYFFNIQDQDGLPLGFGAIYNHSNQNNARFVYDENTNLLVFIANSFIAKGDEIFIHYGENWFNSRKTICKEMSLGMKIWRHLKGFPLRATFVTSVVFTSIYLLRYALTLQHYQ